MTTSADFTFSGKIAYPFVLDKLNKYGKRSLDFFPRSSEDRKAIKETGTRCTIKEAKKAVEHIGEFFYTFTAPGEREVNVVDSEGQPITQLIGNGSEARIRFVVEKFTSPVWGEVARTVLTDVVIDKLIPYEKKEAQPGVASPGADANVTAAASSTPAWASGKMPT